MSRVDRPIIVVGTGRCGSTMFHRILARHSHLGWLSTWNETLPAQPLLSPFSNLYRTPLPISLRHQRWFPKPFEAYRFWEHYLPGFSRRERPLTADDVPEAAIEPLRRAVASVTRLQRRGRFLAKVTGWSRMLYFDRIFPDARFIHITREPRAVVSSWAQAGWLDVTSGPDSDAWQWGHVPPNYRRAWEELGGAPELSAALKIRLDLDDIEANSRGLPGRVHELRYERLITQPDDALRGVLDFCDLPWNRAWQRRVAALRFYDPSNKWKQYLSEEQGARILQFFGRAEDDARAA